MRRRRYHHRYSRRPKTILRHTIEWEYSPNNYGKFYYAKSPIYWQIGRIVRGGRGGHIIERLLWGKDRRFNLASKEAVKKEIDSLIKKHQKCFDPGREYILQTNPSSWRTLQRFKVDRFLVTTHSWEE